MSIRYESIKGAKSAGRLAHRIVQGALGDADFGLSKGRELAARYAGYRDWYHLQNAIGIPQDEAARARLEAAVAYLQKNVRQYPHAMVLRIRDDISRRFGGTPSIDRASARSREQELTIRHRVKDDPRIVVEIGNTDAYPMWLEKIEVRVEEDGAIVGVLRAVVMRQVNRMPDGNAGRLHRTGIALLAQHTSVAMDRIAETLQTTGYVIGEIVLVDTMETAKDRDDARLLLLRGLRESTDSFRNPQGYRLDELAGARGWDPGVNVIETISGAIPGTPVEVVAGDMHAGLYRHDDNIHRHQRPVVMLIGELGRAVGIDTTLTAMMSAIHSRIEDDLSAIGGGGSDAVRDGPVRIVVGPDAVIGDLQPLEGDFA